MSNPATPISADTPTKEIPLEKGPTIGFFLGMEIPAWVRMPEGVYQFEGIADGPKPGLVDLAKLKPGEICVTPGLCYKLDLTQKLQAE